MTVCCVYSSIDRSFAYIFRHLLSRFSCTSSTNDLVSADSHGSSWYSSYTFFLFLCFLAHRIASSYITWPDCVEHDHRVNSMQLSLIFLQLVWGQSRSCLSCHLPVHDISTYHTLNHFHLDFWQNTSKSDQKSVQIHAV